MEGRGGGRGERGETGAAWVLGYARVCEADGVRDVEDEREDDNWHEAGSLRKRGCARGAVGKGSRCRARSAERETEEHGGRD